MNMNNEDILLRIGSSLRQLFTGFLPSPDSVDIAMYMVGVIACVALIFTNAVILILAERKVAGFMQSRYGPNRLGPYGMFQTVADVIKLLTKEDYRPQKVDKWVWAMAPVVLFVPPVMVYAVLPFGDKLVPVDLNIGIFYFIAISSVATIAFLMAGWGSNNKYSMIGGMRAVAQMVSYEIPLVFSILGVVMLTGSLQTSVIVEAQAGAWFILMQPVAFIIYLIAAAAESNRMPFDIVEGESEIIAGPFTEYSGMRWAMFFLAEYASLFAVSAIASTLFLGGWHGPSILPGWVWFLGKTYLMIFVFMWVRWTFPRLRVDQLMSLCWKFLIPVSLANILVTGIGIFAYRAIGG
jgi:NADH-quinone oxidoreductase subunit H